MHDLALIIQARPRGVRRIAGDETHAEVREARMRWPPSPIQSQERSRRVSASAGCRELAVSHRIYTACTMGL
jgi:hypothetical protein